MLVKNYLLFFKAINKTNTLLFIMNRLNPAQKFKIYFLEYVI